MKLPASPRLAPLAVWNNPILVKEVRTRMRGNRAFLLLTVHLVILALALLMVYLLIRSNLSLRMQPGRPPPITASWSLAWWCGWSW